jgi:hypothetical protein
VLAYVRVQLDLTSRDRRAGETIAAREFRV